MTTNHRFLRAAARPLNIGIVGLGYWGPNLLRVLSELEQARVSHICDLDDARVERFSRRFPAALATTRIDDLLEEPELDAVVIATPVFTHAELASRALMAGKHVLVEKPLATSSEDADDLVRLAADNDLVLMCGHTFVYSPPVRAVKELISRGELGEIFFISSSRVNLGLHQRDVGVIWDLAPHDFSILLYWLGELPGSVSAVGRDSIVRGVHDVAFIDLTFPSEVLAHVELSWLAPSKLRRTVVVGSEKMVVYDDGSHEPIRIFDRGVVYHDPETFGEYHLSYRTGDIVSPKLESQEPLALEVEDFIATVRSGGEPTASATLASDVVRLIEGAEASLALDGAQTQVRAEALR
jgi:predicted dehydrogenase